MLQFKTNLVNMIPAKKSLGQNFLKSAEALRAIVTAGDIQPADIILEVGPGKGALTEKLIEKAGKVIAVEKDDRLIGMLQEKFANAIDEGRLEIVHEDILEYHPAFLKLGPIPTSNPPKLGGEASPRAGEVSYKIIANIPYYITGAFIQKFLETEHQPSRMVLMLQKEVAQRIATKDPATGGQTGKESILSISVKAYSTPKYVMTVKSKYFSPAPKVDSAVILIDEISKKRFETISEQKFFELVKTGFAHKRKMLVGNLAEKGIDIKPALQKLGLSEKVRAEDLTVDDWFGLVRYVV